MQMLISGKRINKWIDANPPLQENQDQAAVETG